MPLDLSRREVLQATVSVIPASALGRGGQPPPSDRINLGIIGVNGMGRANLANCAQHADVVVLETLESFAPRLLLPPLNLDAACE